MKLKTIHLHGILAEKFGEFFELSVQSAKEATHALSCQMPEFKLFMLQAEQNGMRFAVFADDRNIGEDEIENVTGASVIHIVPKIMGSGGKAFGWLQVIAGAVLVGLSFTPFGAGWAMGAGIGLMIGGSSKHLTKSFVTLVTAYVGTGLMLGGVFLLTTGVSLTEMYENGVIATASQYAGQSFWWILVWIASFVIMRQIQIKMILLDIFPKDFEYHESK